jgi:hypothetical protein
MEFDIYCCSDEEAKILRDAVYDAVKKYDRCDSYYSNVPSVMFSVYSQVLFDDFGLNYHYYELYHNFTIINKKKMILAKIKYGI